jgi:hypothetical protein
MMIFLQTFRRKPYFRRIDMPKSTVIITIRVIFRIKRIETHKAAAVRKESKLHVQ